MELFESVLVPLPPVVQSPYIHFVLFRIGSESATLESGGETIHAVRCEMSYFIFYLRHACLVACSDVWVGCGCAFLGTLPP